MNEKTSSYIISDEGKLQLVIHRRIIDNNYIQNSYPINTKARQGRINAYLQNVDNIRFISVDSTFQYLVIYLRP